jgi:hypothetical protein
VDHPVAVGAKQCKVREPRNAYACHVQRQYVMTVDMALATRTIGLFEIEAADLAGQAS